MRWRLTAWLAVAVIAGCTLLPVITEASGPKPTEHHIRIVAQQYGYEPHRIVVNQGDTVHLSIVSVDVVHGLFLEGHDIDARIFPGRLQFQVRRSIDDPFKPTEEIVFVASRVGKYRYRCSVTCGTLHPFMQGELIVRPNTTYRTATAGAWMIGLGSFLLLGLGRDGKASGKGKGKRTDLLRLMPFLRWLFTRRWFQFAVVAPNFVVLIFFIVAGLFGSPIGNRNIIVTIVWIFWWFLLITVLVPLGGRVWCLACPLPSAGEWLARRRLVGVNRHAARSRSISGGSLNRTWPRRMQNLWIPNLLFLAMCSFSTVLVTRPALTAVVLLSMLIAAIVVHAVYTRRTFCRYLCPLNAWMGLYSMAAVTELRPSSEEPCRGCRKRACVTGTSGSWSCPWLEKPLRLTRNNYCGLCMECVKGCPNGNITLKLRPFCSDTSVQRLDEAWMAFIMLALVVAYSVTLLGPWGTIRGWANVTEVGNWPGFALHTAAVWLVSLGVVPALWYLAAVISARISRSAAPVRTIFVRSSYILVPLGLMAWIAFSIPLVMVNYSHITSSLSDPLGWGWNLLGTAQQHWTPLLPEWIPLIQVPLLLAGLAIAIDRGWRILNEVLPEGAQAAQALLPQSVLCTVFVWMLLRLYAG